MELKKSRYSMREVQEHLGLGHSATWQRVRDGRLCVQRDGGRTFVTAEELRRYIEACAQQTENCKAAA